jgi:hypothetical protein
MPTELIARTLLISPSRNKTDRSLGNILTSSLFEVQRGECGKELANAARRNGRKRQSQMASVMVV